MFSGNRLTKWLAAGVAALVIGGGTFGIVAAASGGSSTATASSASNVTPFNSGQPTAANAGGGGSNARSGPAAGGSSGKVTSVTASGFTLQTSAGQTVTVTENSSTAYQKGTQSASASAVTAAAPVLVLGTATGTTISASRVVVQPPSIGSRPSWAGQVTSLQRGARGASKAVGQVPANYTQGSGTIVSGPSANQATTAALAVYSGGIVDRVVQLSNGGYEVHYIGVNWPHHIFVSQSFQVVGAD
jgi:hypothetical protein